LAIVLTGCQTGPASGPVDPFLGRTRVPPPGTGAANGLPIDPSYQSGAVPSRAGLSGPAAPAGTLATGIAYPDVAVESGGPSVSLGDVVTVEDGDPMAAQARAEPADPRTPTPAKRWSGQVTRSEPIVRTIHPPPASADHSRPTAAVHPSPMPATRPSRVVNIAELPRPAASGSPDQPAGAGADAFRLVSATEPVDQSPRPAATPSGGFSAAAGSYGYDTSYRWLRGRLEFSQIDQRWKLRYIPLAGDTDDYGGSVVLDDEAKLAGCERGDFVEVHGRVLLEGKRSGFAPVYQISELKRLGGAEG
jgi:hypothetical protein